MGNKIKKTNSWLGFILLISAITYNILANLFDYYVFASPYLFFYGLIILGLVFSLIGRGYLRSKANSSITKIIGKIGLYGNFAVAILFFPPFYFVWGTIIFGP
ncbi:hypothetical protein SAMN05216389_11870 [Oceanobacillus limi]|uniref:Uncharacterized protein n=1 Tax=Oceanobacillus limi TaxID=930131 RepID=A0A1I0G2H4_9BACI|nr:hypothetical protein [Oceanobacillus limi]SET64920.1 hypothetical protein SAMN05216389_11870 [Oceanobacillus limi]